jgi:hypothetical protein
MPQDHIRFYETAVQSIDEENHTLRLRFTDDRPDRENDIMDGDTWDFSDWSQAPSVLFGHDQHNVGAIVGKGLGIHRVEEVDNDGQKIIAHEADIQFDADDPEALRVWGKIKRGFLKTASVGFTTARKEGNRLIGNLLTEISFTPVPANIRATVKSLEDGTIRKEDAVWLRDQAQKTVESFTKFLDNQEGNTEMTDEDLAKVGEVVAQSFEKAVAPLLDRVNKLVTSLETADDQKKQPDTDTKPAPKSDGGTDEEGGISADEADYILDEVDKLLADVEGEPNPDKPKEGDNAN